MEDWEISERKSAEIYGRLVPCSGSKDAKLDIEGLGPFLGLRAENKFTKKASRSISLKELKKAFRQAFQHLSGWFFIIDFNHEHRYIVCSENYWVDIHEQLDNLRAQAEILGEA